MRLDYVKDFYKVIKKCILIEKLFKDLNWYIIVKNIEMFNRYWEKYLSIFIYLGSIN